MKRFPAALAVSVAVLLPLAASAQQAPVMPKPGPEHELLKKDVGVWDATVEMFGAPGGAPAVSKGIETVTMLGGFWQLAEFKSELMGQPFQGLGATGYDAAKKKYVGTWIDSMTPGLATADSTYDAAAKTMSGTMQSADPSGAVTRTRETTEWKDADTRVFTMYGPKGADGKEPVVMRISYKRRK